jgi:hypothetical protein
MSGPLTCVTEARILRMRRLGPISGARRDLIWAVFGIDIGGAVVPRWGPPVFTLC